MQFQIWIKDIFLDKVDATDFHVDCWPSSVAIYLT